MQNAPVPTLSVGTRGDRPICILHFAFSFCIHNLTHDLILCQSPLICLASPPSNPTPGCSIRPSRSSTTARSGPARGLCWNGKHELRLEMEREPVDFLVRKMTPLVDESRDALARLIGADPADVVFVQNATAGVNSVMRSLDFRPGDEILVTAARLQRLPQRDSLRRPADGRRRGPGRSAAADQLAAASDRCDFGAGHARGRGWPCSITSPARRRWSFPSRRSSASWTAAASIRWSTAPTGRRMVPLNMTRLGAAYYTGNCHKWLCAPKAVGFLHVRRDRQQGIQPTIISHGWNKPRPGYSPFQDAFDWPGTLDPTPWLCIGDCIRFLERPAARRVGSPDAAQPRSGDRSPANPLPTARARCRSASSRCSARWRRCTCPTTRRPSTPRASRSPPRSSG